MDKISSFLKENKIVVLIAGVIILIFVVVYALFSLRPTNTQQAVTEQTTNETASPAPAQTATTQTVDTNAQWLKALHQNYTINYLSTWTPETRNVTGGGNEAYFRPAELLNGDVLPAMHIEVSPTNSTTSITDRIATLDSFNLQQSSLNFHGITATTLDGTLFEPVPNDPTRKGVYKKYIFFERGDLTYTITYAYYIVAEDSTMATYYQNLFEAMLESFSFR